MNPNPRLSESNDEADELEILECEEVDYYQDDRGATDFEDCYDRNRD